MTLPNILQLLLSEGASHHRLMVDSMPAIPIASEGPDLICITARQPKPLVDLEVHLVFDGFSEHAVKAGCYHLKGQVFQMEESDRGWTLSIRVLNPAGDLDKRQSDRWKIKNAPIRYRRAGSTDEVDSELIDISASGIGILRDRELVPGEFIEILGLAAVTGKPIGDSVAFEVRVLPTPTKAGLRVSETESQETKDNLLEFFDQLGQVQRFWQSFLDNVRARIGQPIRKGAMLSITFACSQLRKRKNILLLLVEESEFERAVEALTQLERYNRILEEIVLLEDEKTRAEAKVPDQKRVLDEFLNRLNP
jgi:hypothetical protein